MVMDRGYLLSAEADSGSVCRTVSVSARFFPDGQDSATHAECSDFFTGTRGRKVGQAQFDEVRLFDVAAQTQLSRRSRVRARAEVEGW